MFSGKCYCAVLIIILTTKNWQFFREKEFKLPDLSPLIYLVYKAEETEKLFLPQQRISSALQSNYNLLL